LYFSSASIWEISIKESLGKSDFKVSSKKLYDGLIENGYKEIKVSALHAMEVIKLPFIHRDPFDRILVATAIWENMSMLTNDSKLSPYHSLVRVL
jgi:PIN domain nuclease of toxin-antitoxin system